jgi:hypothetical protein
MKVICSWNNVNNYRVEYMSNLKHFFIVSKYKHLFTETPVDNTPFTKLSFFIKRIKKNYEKVSDR